MTNPARLIAVAGLAISCAFFLPPNLAAQTPPKSLPDYSKEAYTVQKIVNQIEFETDGTSTVNAMVVVQMQSASGVQTWGLIRFPYASKEGDAEITDVTVTKPDGRVVRTALENVQDIAAPITVQAPLYSDIKEKQLAVTGLEAGDTLEYHETFHAREPLVPGQFWWGRNFFKAGIVLAEQLEIRVPRDRYVNVKSANVKPVITEEGTYRIYTWNTANLQPKSEDSKAIGPEAGKQPFPDVEITSFHSWDEVARWYQGLEASRIAPTPEIRAEAVKLTQGASTDDEKIRAIYNYVATKIRYIGIDFGIGRYQPHAAAEVLANGYGDCKDKHTLLASLLAGAGIRSYAVLISTARKIDADVPSPGQFDHMITVVPRATGLLWMDTTTEVAPAGFLIAPLRDKEVLAVPDSGPAQLIHTPADPPFPSSFIFKINGKMDSDGTLTSKVDASFRGDLELLFRAAFRAAPQTQWKELVQSISQSWSFAGTVSEVDASPPESTDAPFSLNYAYERKNYPNWPDAIGPPFPPLNLTQLPEKDTSSDPIRLESPGEYLLDAKIELPKGVIAKTRVPIDIIKDFAEYHAAYVWEAGSLHAERRIVIHMREIPRSRSEEYRSFWKAVDSDSNSVVAVTASGLVPSSDKKDVEPPETNDARADQLRNLGDTLYNQGDLDGAIAEYRKTLQMRPDDAHAHRALADALFSQHNFDGASTEYLEALRLNPDDAGAHNSLGRVLENKGNLDAAVMQYRQAVKLAPDSAEDHSDLGRVLMQKDNTVEEGMNEGRQAVKLDPTNLQIRKSFAEQFQFGFGQFVEELDAWREVEKLSPGDSEAQWRIGGLLIRLKRYPEALADLEPATEQHPDDAALHFELGRAFIFSGEPDKAIAMFKMTLVLDSSAGQLSGVSHELADQNLDLDLALQYAEQAADKQETAASNIDLKTLTPSDLWSMVTLSDVWDAVGWTEFRRGDMATAERYLNAAWKLNEDSLASEHLAQLYHKLGQMNDAIHFYSLSIADSQLPQDEARQRLTDLLGGAARFNESVNKARIELRTLRTISLPRLTTAPSRAEFFLVFDSHGQAQIKFISGSEELRNAGNALISASYNVIFPDDRKVKLVRRGTLECPASSQACDFILLPALWAASLN